MADSDTTQQVTFDALIAKAAAIIAKNPRMNVPCEAKKKAFAQAKALLELMQSNRASRDAEKRAETAVCEADKRAETAAREALKKAIAEVNQRTAACEAQKKAIADTPFLTTTQWLGVAGLAVSLQAFLT